MTIHFFFLVRQQCVFLLLHRESLMRVFSEWFQLNDFLASGVGQFYILISKNIVLAPASVFIFCYIVDVLWHFGSEKVNGTVSFFFLLSQCCCLPTENDRYNYSVFHMAHLLIFQKLSETRKTPHKYTKTNVDKERQEPLWHIFHGCAASGGLHQASLIDTLYSLQVILAGAGLLSNGHCVHRGQRAKAAVMRSAASLLPVPNYPAEAGREREGRGQEEEVTPRHSYACWSTQSPHINILKLQNAALASGEHSEKCCQSTIKGECVESWQTAFLSFLSFFLFSFFFYWTHTRCLLLQFPWLSLLLSVDTDYRGLFYGVLPLHYWTVLS